MDNAFPIVIGVVAALVVVGLVVWAIVHHRYVQSLRAKGWEYDGSPEIDIAYGLNNPPFGLGFDRSVDHLVTGATADGVPFRAFTYRSDAWRGFVVTLPLPASLPPFAALGPTAPEFPGRPTQLAQLASAEPQAPEYTRQLLDVVTPVLTTDAGAGYRFSVDHDRVVLAGVGRGADEIEAALGVLTDLRARVLASPAAGTPGPPPPPHLAVAGHPDWVYVPRDDDMLEAIAHSTGGSDHEAHDVLHSPNAGLPFIRLRHTWETQHTRTDSDGKTHTETRHHSEILCEFRTTFPFREISLNWGVLSGPKVRFESEAFNDAVTVRCPHPKFASDVIHPRQMEFLMAVDGPAIRISDDGRIQVRGGEFQPFEIEYADWYLRAFFGGVPDFVWKELGAWPRPLPEADYDVLMRQLHPGTPPAA